ncbi:MAG: hypothetical protein V8T36_03070 [Ruthenibacterium lactatiformans]
MLRLILGISGTGKTGGRVLAEMKVRAAARRRSTPAGAPEQFSSSAETMVYRSLGDAFSACAEVYSTLPALLSWCSRPLARRAAVKTLTDAATGRCGAPCYGYAGRRAARPTAVTGAGAGGLLQHAVADSHQRAENGGRKQGHRDAAGRGPHQRARTAAESCSEAGGLIFAAYEGVHDRRLRHADPGTGPCIFRPPRAPHGWTNGVFGGQSRIFIDNFDGFTAPEYRMLEKLVEAEECTVTLCCDGLSDNEAGLGLFSPVKKIAGAAPQDLVATGALQA